MSLVDNQIADIQKILDQATTDFQTAEYRFSIEKENQSKLAGEIANLTSKTNEQIHLIKQESVANLQHLMDSKQLIMDSMIDQTRLKIVQELKETLSEKIHNVLSDIMKNHLDKQLHENLNDDAIRRLDDMLSSPQNRNKEMDSSQQEKKIKRG